MPMSILPPHPDSIPADNSRVEMVSFISPADETSQTAMVYAPSSSAGPLPLVLVPHPITWTPEQEYHGGWNGMQQWGYHRGWYGLADAYNVIIALPYGHHRREELCSLAAPEQITDLASLIDILPAQGYTIDQQRVYSCGKSMGGQEALVLAGKYPDRITAAIAFNPIVDLAAWQVDLAKSPLPEIREFGTDQRVANEVGGLPSEVPDLYLERSAISYADSLASVPTLIFWTDHDLIVPGQASQHTLKLCQAIKSQRPTAPIAEYNHSTIHGVQDFSGDIGWQLHEWCDYELALRWLLMHSK